MEHTLGIGGKYMADKDRKVHTVNADNEFLLSV